MKAMRAESFIGYGGLKLVEIPRPALAEGRVLVLTQAGFQPGKTVLAPAIGGAVGNAVTQLARAQGAGKAISTTTNPAKAAQARARGFDDVIDLSAESLANGVARLTGGRGVDVVIESVGGALTGQALATLALHGVLTSLGYSAGRKTTIDVTDLIWKRASMSGFALAAQSHATTAAAWATILPLLDLETGEPDRRTNLSVGRGRRGPPPSDRRPSLRQSDIGRVVGDGCL
jgi:NADPH:quinone reductase-like Zn-dependent oxidoreductase